ncbi:MAG: ABC transporter ATP-binding protein [Bacteroidaceae bacterium]|nr:ABC transporter ATP-binding protein [Bacteroidaceae bacterium]
MLEIKNITFGYAPNRNVFQDFTLTFGCPGVYGLLGKNGTGKSTLLYLIMGLLRPKSGVVSLDGKDTSLREASLLADLFIVPEDYSLPKVRLEDYVNAIAPLYPKFSMDRLSKSLNVFDMSTDVSLGELSMGQSKKAYMAIALATGSRILLMDEPTNGLDIPSKSQFRKAIAAGLDENQTVIISTHQVKDVELLLDHVAIIDRNRVVVNDKMDSLFSDNESIDLERLFLNNVTH